MEYIQFIKIYMTINILLYSGITLLILGVILFIISQYKLRSINNEIDRQEKLHQSFIKNKTKWIYLKNYSVMNIRGFVAVKVANF